MPLLRRILGSECLLLSLASSQASDGQQTVIRVESPFVLVDVITQDTKTALPVSGLKKEDFRLLDNGLEMPIQSFDLGTRYGARPITLWFAVICNEVNWDENGSGFIRGKSKLLRPSLDHLDQNDTVGVAHWCDDKTYGVDFTPSRDLDGALRKLEDILTQRAKDPDTRPGELALQGMIRQILGSEHTSQIQPLPVIVFLYGDHSGLERNEADRVVKDILETSGIVFGINDGAVPVSPIYLNNEHAQPNVARFLSVMTGGQFLSVTPAQFSTSLEYILVQVHFRYVLGFQPTVQDGKIHKLTVDLTDSAKQRFPSIRLTYRKAYVPTKTKS
jgi:hypothetical protein